MCFNMICSLLLRALLSESAVLQERGKVLMAGLVSSAWLPSGACSGACALCFPSALDITSGLDFSFICLFY